MRSSLASSLCSLLLLTACPGDDGSASGTETDSATGTGTGGSSGTEGVDETGADTTEGSTGEPAGSDLEPCDPRLEDPCDQGVCAGSPMGGYFCRPGCSSMAEPGTPCGSDDECLPVTPGSEETACFDVGDCDFLTGEGCNPATGETCVVVGVEPLRTACVPTGDAGTG